MDFGQKIKKYKRKSAVSGTHEERVVLEHGFDQYESIEPRYGLDDVHHLLVADLDQLPAIVTLVGQWVRARPRHPVVALNRGQRDTRARVLVQ